MDKNRLVLDRTRINENLKSRTGRLDQAVRESLVEDMANSVKDLEHMIYGVLASYLKQLTGEPWVLFKDKVRKPDERRDRSRRTARRTRTVNFCLAEF